MCTPDITLIYGPSTTIRLNRNPFQHDNDPVPRHGSCSRIPTEDEQKMHLLACTIIRYNTRRQHEPCNREKYSSEAFFMISGVHVASVNMSKSLALVVLRSLHHKLARFLQNLMFTKQKSYHFHHQMAHTGLTCRFYWQQDWRPLHTG